MNKIVILSAGPGLPEIVEKYGHSSDWIPDALTDYDLDFDIRKVYSKNFDNSVDADGWIITGSKYSVYDNLDWIKNLKAFLKRIVCLDKPILGICFGHQILADVLGGIVEKNPLGWELGSYNINLTEEGQKSALFKDVHPNYVFYESHQDYVKKLPANSIPLANTDKSNQSFKYNNSIYGVQFHPEFTWDVTKALMDARIKRGIKVDNLVLNKSVNGNKILHNFIDILERRK